MKLNSKAAIVLVLAAGTLSLPANAQQPVTYTYAYNGPALQIFRDSANIITVVNLFVPRAITITKVTVNVEIDYPNPGDLNVFMYSPILTRTKLLERNCSSSASVSNVTFDDAAPTKYSDVCPSASGTYRGNEPLSNYNGQIALGTWSLAVENNGSDSVIGYLRGFTVTVTGTPVTTKPITGPNAVFNAAGYQSGAIAPGEMIYIEGVNLGPSTAVTAPAGNLPTSLGGSQVTFDGTPGALSYASQYVLVVQAPFSITPGQQTAMRVVNGSSTSDPVNLDVLNTAPGVYTQSADGRGAASAVNPDGSTNSVTRPASRGQYVAVYANGLGAVSPALATGQAPPVSPLSNTTLPVTATVDGISATVAFAGAAPGFPGLYQVNVQIPLGASSGARLLTLFSGGVASQSGVSIFIQ
jgi:uncharacterized protein (TIGR03437 family)